MRCSGSLLAALLGMACQDATRPAAHAPDSEPDQGDLPSAPTRPAAERRHQVQLDPVWIVAPDRVVTPPRRLASSGRDSDAGSLDGGRAPSAYVDGGPAYEADLVIRQGLHARARACYNKSLKEDSGQRGRIVIQLRLGPDGNVDDAIVIYNSGLAASTAQCIADGGRALVFQAPGGTGVTINCPMNFVRSLDGLAGQAESVVRGDFLKASSTCYEAALFSDPAIEGYTTYYVEVGESGRVTSVLADPHPRLPRPLLACVAEAFKASAFPPSVRVLVPIRFHPTTDIHRPRTR